MYFVDENERYIEITNAPENNIPSLWNEFCTKYKGYEAVFTYQDTLAPVEVLTKGIGAQLLENSTIMELSPVKFITHANHEITVITYENYDNFAKFHDNHDSNMYWNSQRILAEFEKWRIFAISRNGHITGYAMMQPGLPGSKPKQSLIFCVTADNINECASLLSATASCSFELGHDSVKYFAETDIEMEATQLIGFCKVGSFVSYKVNINPN